MPLVVRRFIWRWRGECVMFALWAVQPMFVVYPLSRIYRALLGAAIRRTGLFDEAYYADTNGDVANSRQSMLVHYVGWGDAEGRCPVPVFDPAYYRQNAKGFTRRVNSLLHYVWVGCHRDFSPSPWFDTAFYLGNNKDVARSGLNPLLHYLRWGGLEGRSPSPKFDSDFYLQTYPDVRESGVNPLLHYIRQGRKEGRLTRDMGAGDAGEANRSNVIPLWEKETDFNLATLEKQIIRQDSPPEVDVVVPVYRNRALTWRCLKSVLTSRNETPYALIVIDDASPEPELRRDLEAMASRGWLTLIRNEQNLGFVATVNTGMRLHSGRDVVLLNSDTEVHEGWLDRLHRAAYSASDVASITPLSNNATICSYPRFLHDNPYPLEVGYAELDQLCAQVNAGVTVEAPTGVGFCMYLRREAITAIGLFDEAAFGKGYGEENDWCQRAIEQGLRNLIAADTFVRHFGSASFQGEKGKRVAQALRALAKKHPTYQAQVQRFITGDPLREARQRIDWARLSRQARSENVLFACHNRGGGAERHLQEDAERQRNRGRGVFFLRPVPGCPSRVQIKHPDCQELPNLPSVPLADTGRLAGLLSELGITCIHSHGLVDYEPDAAEHILRITQINKIPLHVDIHDYKVICPRINLAKANGHYCGERGSEKACYNCLKTEGNDFGVYDIRAWREMHHRVLKAAEKIYVPDIDVAERLQRYYPDVTCRVLPHENIEYQPNPRPLLPGERLRVVVIGEISKIKGYDVLLECAQDARKRRLPIEYILMGYSMDDDVLIKTGVKITGKYREEDALQKLEELEPHVAFFPALWPETYSYTLTLALRAGLPVAAFEIGAIANRMRALGWDQGLMPMNWVDNPVKVNKLLLSYAECADSMGNVRRFSYYTQKSAVHTP